MRLPLALALAALPAYASAQPASDPNHAEHHPPNASAPKAPAESLPKAAPSDTTMKSMHEMHARMMAAKTMEERQALMADHMKAMQDGMAMMGRMKGSTSSEAMTKRMDMMEIMMQVMMDREADRASAAALKSMQEMRDRMMAATTAQERHALMADHMKAMQDGMAMMSRMRGGTSSEAMSKRMDMMEMMMQMMMDREADRARAPK